MMEIKALARGGAGDRGPCSGSSPRWGRIQLHDDGALRTFLDQPVVCPICHGSELGFYQLASPEDHEQWQFRQARKLVNWQMYRRDHADQRARDGFVSFPASVMGDDRLPPTPPGWWEAGREP
jgi:hypothetical protein